MQTEIRKTIEAHKRRLATEKDTIAHRSAALRLAVLDLKVNQQNEQFVDMLDLALRVVAHALILHQLIDETLTETTTEEDTE